MRKKFNFDLQLFGDGDGGNGGAGSGDGGQGSAGKATYSYEQAEEIANASAEKAQRAALADYFRKQGMTEDEITAAIADYKAKQKSKQPDVAAIERERDEAVKKNRQYENEKLLSSMKVRSDDMDYVMFKVSALVTDKKDFKTAAEEWLKENPRYKEGGSSYRMSSGAAAGDSGRGSANGNEEINAMIRGAFGRK